MNYKKANSKANPTSKKEAKSTRRLTSRDLRLVWQVSAIDIDGEWGWNRIDCPSFLKTLWNKMRNFETMTWSEILGQNNHEIPVYNIIKPAQKRLSELGYDDQVQLMSFHVTGKQRIWAIRSDTSSYLLWWDPDRAICPSHKKHT